MTTSRPARRRPQPAVRAPTDELARLRAARDEIDAVDTEQRRREDTLIAEYVSATTEAADIESRRDATVADLDQKRLTVLGDTKQGLANAEKRQAAALVELNKRRSVQKLAILFGLSRKRIEKLIRLHHAQSSPLRPSAPASSGAAAAAAGGAAEGNTARQPPSIREQPPRPPSSPDEPTACTAAEPAAPPALDRSATQPSPRSSPAAVPAAPSDSTERLF